LAGEGRGGEGDRFNVVIWAFVEVRFLGLVLALAVLRVDAWPVEASAATG
jgi:hypothetical protein